MTSVLPPVLTVLGLICSPLAIGALVLWRAHCGYMAAQGGQES
jgi:hypothetical protein